MWDFCSSRKVPGWWLHQLHSWHSATEGGERRMWNNLSSFTALLRGNLSILNFPSLTHSVERTLLSRVSPVPLLLNHCILQGGCESFRAQASPQVWDSSTLTPSQSRCRWSKTKNLRILQEPGIKSIVRCFLSYVETTWTKSWKMEFPSLRREKKN